MNKALGYEPIAMLTSAGATTEAIRTRLRNLVIQRQVEFPRILRLSDGWAPFGPDGHVPLSARFGQSLQSPATRKWSAYWLRQTFGNQHTLMTLEAHTTSRHDLASELDSADILLLPGGNTFQLARGISPHRRLLQEYIRGGRLLAVGESAGSIIMGNTLSPATLPPADPRPAKAGFLRSLYIVDSPVVVHAADNETAYDIPHFGQKAMQWFMSHYIHSSQEQIAQAGFHASNALILHDTSAMVIDTAGVAHEVAEPEASTSAPHLAIAAAPTGWQVS